jgi:hypothetical protein
MPPPSAPSSSPCLHSVQFPVYPDSRYNSTLATRHRPGAWPPPPHHRETEATMDDGRFDAMVRRCGRGATRRDALRLLGRGVLAGALLPVRVPDAAAGRAKRRCRRKGGVFLGKGGQCRCAYACNADASRFPCQNNPDCVCQKAVDGTGFCGDNPALSTGCSTNANCSGGKTCIVFSGCTGSGTPCTTSGNCIPGVQACVDGTCQTTTCSQPCPP